MQPSAEAISAARGITEWVCLALDSAGVVAIAAGGIAALVEVVRAFRRSSRPEFKRTRLALSNYVALALEFQLAADVLETAITPDWPSIGRLAAIAAIRTGLNYFLDRDIHDERRALTAAPE